MPRNADKTQRFLFLGEDLGIFTAPSPNPRPRKRRRPVAARAVSPLSTKEKEVFSTDRLARTRRLLLAALRVWELRNGIRDSF